LAGFYLLIFIAEGYLRAKLLTEQFHDFTSRAPAIPERDFLWPKIIP
jgi:hypothetical protein